MQLQPRYTGPRLLVDHTTTRPPTGVVLGQRRRLEALLESLDAAAWGSPTRCTDWRVHEVVAHLVTVNDYWAASARAARRGTPLQLLGGFDPAATPSALLSPLAGHTPRALLDRLLASHDALEASLTFDDVAVWELPAETPIGHLALRSMAAHALWDSWIHERDIAVPLGIAVPDEPEELAEALRYVAGLAAALVVLHDLAPATALALETTDPSVQLVVDVEAVDGVATVALRDEPAGPRPCLRGDAARLLDALSLRAPLPHDAPAAWHERRAAAAHALGSPSPAPSPEPSPGSGQVRASRVALGPGQNTRTGLRPEPRPRP